MSDKDKISKLLDALNDVTSCLRSWVEIADPEDVRIGDEEALAKAQRAIDDVTTEYTYSVTVNDPVEGKVEYPPNTYDEVVKLLPWAAGLNIDSEAFESVVLLTTYPTEFTIRRVGVVDQQEAANK